MQRIERTARLAHPPAEVFAFLSDPDNLPRWQPGIRTVERLDDGPIGVGTSARVIRDLMGQAVAVTVTVNEFTPDERLGLTTSASGFAVSVEATLAPEDAGTRLTVVATVRAESLMLAPLEGALASAGGAELDAGLARLEQELTPVPENPM